MRSAGSARFVIEEEKKTEGEKRRLGRFVIEREKKKLPKISVAIPLAPEQQHTEHVQLERSDAEGRVMASGGDGSETGSGQR